MFCYKPSIRIKFVLSDLPQSQSWKLFSHLRRSYNAFWVAGVAQRWERSSPTNVAWVRFRPGVICGLSLLLVLALLRGFFSWFSGFPPSKKTNISKFQFDQERGPAWKLAEADVVSALNIVNLFLKNPFCILVASYPKKRCRIPFSNSQHWICTAILPLINYNILAPHTKVSTLLTLRYCASWRILGPRLPLLHVVIWRRHAG